MEYSYNADNKEKKKRNTLHYMHKWPVSHWMCSRNNFLFFNNAFWLSYLFSGNRNNKIQKIYIYEDESTQDVYVTIFDQDSENDIVITKLFGRTDHVRDLEYFRWPWRKLGKSIDELEMADVSRLPCTTSPMNHRQPCTHNDIILMLLVCIYISQ